MAEENVNPETSQSGEAVNVEYLFRQVRTAQFRSIPVDGAWGAINGQGNISLAFFNERPPLPDEVTYSYNQNGKVFIPSKSLIGGKPVENNLVLRQYEAEIIMSLETAKLIQNVLANFIAMREQTSPSKEG